MQTLRRRGTRWLAGCVAGLAAGVAWPGAGGGAARAQEPDPKPEFREIRVTPDWTPGTVFHISRHRLRIDTLPGGRTRRFEHTTPATVAVVKRTDRGYQLRWTWGEAKLAGLAGESLLVRGLTNLGAGVALDVLVDDLAAPVQLANRDAVAKALTAKTAQLGETLAEAGVPDAIARQVARTRYRAGQVQGMFLLDPKALLLASGGNFLQGKDQEYADQTGNPLGGRPLPTRAVFRLGAVSDDELVVTWSQRLDEAAARPLLLEAAAARAKRAGRPAPAADQVPAADVRHDATFVIDRKTAWPRRAQVTVVTVSGERRRTVTTTTTLVRVTQEQKK